MKIGIDLDGVVIDSETTFRTYEEIFDLDVLKEDNLINREEPKFQARYNWNEEQPKVEENNKDTEKEKQQENTNKNNEENKNNNSNPKTGDNIMLYVVIASVAVLGLGATTIVAKKEKMS